MPKTPAPPSLGSSIEHRRRQLRISQAEAARKADVPRSTWIAWEKGIRPKEANHLRIERVCEWLPGSVADILEGRAPTPIHVALASVTPLHPGMTQAPADDALIRELRAMDLPEEYRDFLIAAYRAETAGVTLRYRRLLDRAREANG